MQAMAWVLLSVAFGFQFPFFACPGAPGKLSSKMGCWSSSASLKDMETRRTSSDGSARELRPAAVLTSVLLDDVPTCQTWCDRRDISQYSAT